MVKSLFEDMVKGLFEDLIDIAHEGKMSHDETVIYLKEIKDMPEQAKYFAEIYILPVWDTFKIIKGDK